MDMPNRIHFSVTVYDDGPPPDNPATEVSLCPDGRKTRVELTQDLSLVTCRRCKHLLAMVGIRPA
jgi:hypothetical protein